MATFVLVHGAWHGGWCWERIVPLLEAEGHVVFAPDLLGMGKDQTPLAEVTLDRWVEQITELIRQQGAPVVLVGHSRGGIVISQVAERAPELVARLVYVAAALVPSGESVASMMEGLSEGNGMPPITMAEDGSATFDPECLQALLYNETEPKWFKRAASLLCPEPMWVMGTPLHLTNSRFGSVSRAYVECANDVTAPLQFQQAMQRKLPCDPVMTLESDHSPFYSMPEKLARCLTSLAS